MQLARNNDADSRLRGWKGGRTAGRMVDLQTLRKLCFVVWLATSLLASAGTICRAVASDNAMADPAAESPYVLHTNDQLLITVMGHDDYTKTVTVLSDGTFNYPIVGIVPAAGLTIKQLTGYMQKGLSSELDEPKVTISVTQFYAPVVNVVGAVGKAGSYTYEHDWHVIDAIAAAQGLSSPPNLVSITLVRTGSDPVQVDGMKLMSGTDPTQNPTVLPGDTLLVQQRDVSTANVEVSGEVKNPGAYPVPVNGESPLAALVSAGGTNEDAALTQVQLSHLGVVTTLNLMTVNDTLVSNVPLPTVMGGDVILVPKIVNIVSVLGAVNWPQDYCIPEGKQLTLSGALGLAKGNVPQADLAKISVLREVNNKPTIIDVNLVKGFKDGTPGASMPIEPGDVVFVPMKGNPVNNNALLYLFGPLLSVASHL